MEKSPILVITNTIYTNQNVILVVQIYVIQKKIVIHYVFILRNIMSVQVAQTPIQVLMMVYVNVKVVILVLVIWDVIKMNVHI